MSYNDEFKSLRQLLKDESKSEGECMQNTGIKHDKGKLRLDLLPPEAMRALGEVFTYGASKYGDRNWEQGIDSQRVYAAMERHLLAWREGEYLDPESGLPHLSHVLTNAAMLHTLEARKQASSIFDVQEALARMDAAMPPPVRGFWP